MKREPVSASIKSASQRDVIALSALAKTTYAETFAHSMTPAELEWQLAHTRSEPYFRERLAKDAILVAIAEERIVGYVQVTDVTLPISSSAGRGQQINALYVEREFRARGIGRQLMDAALELGRVRSAANLFLDVWNENSGALEFYTRYGFEVIGECEVVVDSRVIGKDLMMQLPLAGRRALAGRAGMPIDQSESET